MDKARLHDTGYFLGIEQGYDPGCTFFQDGPMQKQTLASDDNLPGQIG